MSQSNVLTTGGGTAGTGSVSTSSTPDRFANLRVRGLSREMADRTRTVSVLLDQINRIDMAIVDLDANLPVVVAAASGLAQVEIQTDDVMRGILRNRLLIQREALVAQTVAAYGHGPLVIPEPPTRGA